MRYHIGIDIGGTFTDVTVLKEDGAVLVFKTPSTPQAPELAVLRGIELALERGGVRGEDCADLVVSATVGLNAIIERKGAAVGLLVTAGFEDMLELGRVKMKNVFSLTEVRQPPLVRKTWVRGITERIDARGRVLRPLDPAQLVAAGRELVEQGAETLAVLTLHAHRNPVHERMAKSLLSEAFPSIHVAVSSELWPQIREYERATVLAMNSYIAPKVRSYVGAIEEKKQGLGLSCPVEVSASNGGLVPATDAKERPIATLLSGPSAGVVAAVDLMRRTGMDRAITFDMGGTSADICVLQGDDIPYAWGQEIEGLPIVMPYVDVSAIGSGGGSIAYVDNVGLLRVGPQSAGSVPGPAAYGRGGTRPTVTDAYLVSGFIDPGNVIGSEIRLDREKAAEAIRTLAAPLGMDLEAAASGVIKVTTSVQVAELTRLAAKKGIDVRDFVLVPFGGAGPTQACLLADELHIRRIAVPSSPGVFCALGSVLADFRLDYVRTLYGRLDRLDEAEVEDWYASTAAKGRDALGGRAGHIEAIDVLRSADVRYQGQSFEVAIPFRRLDEVPERFRSEYQKLYGMRDDALALEIVGLRATVVGRRRRPQPAWSAAHSAPAPIGERHILLDGEAHPVPVFRRGDLHSGWQADGPFLIDQPDTTCLVTPGWHAHVDATGTLHLHKESNHA